MEKVFDGIVEDFGIHTVAFCSLPTETAKGFIGKIGNGKSGNGYSVPAFASTLNDKFVKSLTFEFLFSASGTVMVLAAII